MDVSIKKVTDIGSAPYDLLLDADPDRKVVDEYLARGELYIATAGGETVGEYVLIPTRPMTLELVNVAVAPAHQGKGIGKQLVKHAIETARRSGTVVLELGTGNSGFTQLALYQKCGFRIVGVDLDFFTHHYDEKIVENDVWCRDMLRMQIVFPR